MWLLCNCKNGISSYELHRALGVTQKTAWFMLHRIRARHAGRSFLKMGSTADPSRWMKPSSAASSSNMHRCKRQGRFRHAVWRTGKAIVMGMLDRKTRQVRAESDSDASRELCKTKF